MRSIYFSFLLLAGFYRFRAKFTGPNKCQTNKRILARIGFT